MGTEEADSNRKLYGRFEAVYLLGGGGGFQELLVDREAALLNGGAQIPAGVRGILGIKGGDGVE